MNENENVIFGTIVKRPTDPSSVYGLIDDNYLDGLIVFKQIKHLDKKDLKIVIEYTDEGMLFKIINKITKPIEENKS